MNIVSNLMRLQAPNGTLESSRLRPVTDPIALRPIPEARMAHFFEGVFDLSPESHLSRFVKVLLGDAGAGYMSKVLNHAHSQNILATMRYADLDAFYGDVLGLKRMSWEHTDPAKYFQINTPAEWDEIEARDASYRSRIEAFSRAIALGATPSGLRGLASALLGTEVRLYESYLMIDHAGSVSTSPTPARPRTYGEVEADYGTYGAMQGSTYADIEGNYGSIGRAEVNDRAHFVVRPMRPISSEEDYQLRRVMERFKPVGTLMTVDTKGLAVRTPVKPRGASADSVHWEVLSLIHPEDVVSYNYGTHIGAFEAPRPAMADKQTEAWSYNSDIVSVRGYREISEHLWPGLDDPEDHEQRITGVPDLWSANNATPGLWSNFQRINYREGRVREYRPEMAISDHQTILRGRAASNGGMISSPVIRHHDLSRQIDPSVGRNLYGTRQGVAVREF